MRRTPLPPRPAPMSRGRHLRVVEDSSPIVVPFRPRTPIKAVSKKRARQNRQRAVMADRRWPDRRQGTVLCVVPGPPHPADDLHEPLSRARGGGIVDENNSTPLCRAHHDAVTFRPESELGWAYQAGLIKHSWQDDGGDAA